MGSVDLPGNVVVVRGKYATWRMGGGLGGDRREQSGQAAACGRLRHQRVGFWPCCAWPPRLCGGRFSGSASAPPHGRPIHPLRLAAQGFEACLEAPVAETHRVESSADLQSWESLVSLTHIWGRVPLLDPMASGVGQR